MKKLVFFATGVFLLFVLGGCVENSKKYKALQAQLDTLNTTYSVQSAEMESMFADLNDISSGMQSLREAEHLLTLESSKEVVGTSSSRKQLMQLKNDVRSISEAINSYKDQILRLEGKNKRQSAEFKKLIVGLNEELELKSQRINEISEKLIEKDRQLAGKNQEINQLTQNVDVLNQETAGQKETINKQDQEIHMANYLIGTRKELKDADVITRQGIFCPPIVSSQAQKGNFTNVDVRQVKSIDLNAKKAKVLSVHPIDSYILETKDDGTLVLKINDEQAFWKQTKYLVVMIS